MLSTSASGHNLIWANIWDVFPVHFWKYKVQFLSILILNSIFLELKVQNIDASQNIVSWKDKAVFYFSMLTLFKNFLSFQLNCKDS